MITVRILPVGQLSTNCYLVIEDKTNKALIIDPGDDGDYISRIIQDEEAKPIAILATHGHFDHILAATELKLSFNIPFMMNFKDKDILSKSDSSALFFTGIKADPISKIDKDLKDNDQIKLGGNIFEVIETPGHTPGSISLYCKGENIIFSGDLIFKNGIGRTDFSYSDSKKMSNSIDKVLKLPEKTLIYSGHGDVTSVGKEKENIY